MLSIKQSSGFMFFLFTILIFISKSIFANLIDTHELSYDQVALNQNTWQEVDMVYWTTIDGKPYSNTINLLRPKSYLTQHHLNHTGQKLTLTLSEIGLNHNVVTITAIKPAPYFKACYQQHCSQVIGLFKHYATNVKTYRFKDLTTQSVFIIHATPNHPFYVKNKQQFVPISEVSSHDQLVGKNKHFIKLICTANYFNHCGIVYSHQKPIIVYNLEIYQQHDYRVGQESVLVHNCSNQSDGLIGKGRTGEVFTDPDNQEWVIKRYSNPEAMANANYEAEMFNLYHGKDSAWVKNMSDNTRELHMKKIPGRRVDDILQNWQENEKDLAILVDAVENKGLYKIRDKLTQLGMAHGDITGDNLLFDPNTEEFNLIDFELALHDPDHENYLRYWSRDQDKLNYYDRLIMNHEDYLFKSL